MIILMAAIMVQIWLVVFHVIKNASVLMLVIELINLEITVKRLNTAYPMIILMAAIMVQIKLVLIHVINNAFN